MEPDHVPDLLDLQISRIAAENSKSCMNNLVSKQGMSHLIENISGKYNLNNLQCQETCDSSVQTYCQRSGVSVQKVNGFRKVRGCFF